MMIKIVKITSFVSFIFAFICFYCKLMNVLEKVESVQEDSGTFCWRILWDCKSCGINPLGGMFIDMLVMDFTWLGVNCPITVHSSMDIFNGFALKMFYGVFYVSWAC